jgi:hypothetical protein
MKRIIAALAIVLALSVTALAQPPPHFTATYSLAANADPSGICTNEVRFWINNVTNDMFSCYNGTWHPVGGAAAFPITDVDGASSVTLSGDATAETGSFLLANATDVAGWNAALGGTLGASLFASNATDQASVNIDIDAQTITTSYVGGGGESSTVWTETQIYSRAADSWPDYSELTQNPVIGFLFHSRRPSVNADTTNVTVSYTGFVVDADSPASAFTAGLDVNGPTAKVTMTATESGGARAVTVESKASVGARVSTIGTQPTCDSTNRGGMWRVEGGAGVADTFEACMKSAADTYAWVVIATNP